MDFDLFCENNVVLQNRNISRLFCYANDNRNEGFFNDVTIKTENSNFKANGLILSCFSKYCERHLRKKFHDCKTVDVNEVDDASVKTVIDYMYSIKIYINQDNVVSVLKAALKLEVENLATPCCEYLRSNVNFNNCIFIFEFAYLYRLESLQIFVHDFIIKHFKSITETSTFKLLSKDKLEAFLTKLNRNEFDETLIYDAMVTWTRHDKQKRNENFCELLLGMLNVEKLSYEFWTKIASEKLIRGNLQCSNFVMDQLAKRGGNNELSVVSVGGDYTLSKVEELFNLSGKPAKLFPGLPVKLHSHSLLKLGGYAYCIGGDADLAKPTKQIWQLDLNKHNKQWEQVSQLNERRRDMGAAILFGTLVVAGGFDGETVLRTAEIYFHPFRQWKGISSLTQPRYGNALVSCNDSLYAIGGFGGSNTYLSSVEQLTDLNEPWNLVEKMKYPRVFFAAVCYNGIIYVIGGRSGKDDSNLLKSVEKYDPILKCWSDVASLNEERFGHSACVLQEKIFVIGGKNKEGKINRKIECYDPANNTWNFFRQTEYEWFRHSVFALT